jgi:quercetin dioxygenase-like cupin family protein
VIEGELVLDVILKSFENPDETRRFEKGKFEIVKIGGMTLGRATYEPGWKWSRHVSPLAGAPLCVIEHVGLVISGRAMAGMQDGREIELNPGQLFYIPAVPHGSRVIGEEPYISLHFLGADSYTK